MFKYYLLLFSVVIGISCNSDSNSNTPLKGHSYYLRPLTKIIKMRDNLIQRTVVHHYSSSKEVEITQYIADEPVKTEVMKYTIDGDAYNISGERYTITKDTGDNYTLSVDTIPTFELEFIK